MTPKRAKRRSETATLSPPRLADPPEEKADWAECWSLVGRDGNTSFSELRSVMEIGGSADAYTGPEAFEYDEIEGAGTENMDPEDTDLYEAAAEAVFVEISDRILACGETSYPFDVSNEGITVRPDPTASIYTFLLLLSKYGPDAGPKKSGGAKLFEELCAHAVSMFLGGEEGLADSQVFGFPRRVTCDGFANALDALCGRLAEGEGSKYRPTTPDQKDAKLDVVGWKSFRDKRKGRLIVFGQCAAGDDWREKRSELIATHDWCTCWMKDRPAVWPLRAFFVPHRVGEKEWFEACVNGGLLFDRCRIISHADTLPATTAEEIAGWSKYVMEKHCEN